MPSQFSREMICEHCKKRSVKTLRSRRAFFEEDGSVRAPRGAGPAAAEAQRRSQMVRRDRK